MSFMATDGFNGLPMQRTEGKREPEQVAPMFAEMVDAKLQLMEENNRRFREKGGYYLTLHPGSGASESYPPS